MSEIEDMIQFVMDDNFNKANDVFSELIGAKVSDAMDQEKISVAANIFNDGESVEEIDTEEDIDLDDIDLDAIAAEFELDDVDFDFDDEEQE